MGTRKVPFSREIFIEEEDFLEDPPKKFYRLAPGREVRLRYAYFIECVGAVKDEKTGKVIELRCTYDPKTRGGDAPDGRKASATLHWVSAPHAIPAEARLYDHLFTRPNPSDEEGGLDFKAFLNPDSLKTLSSCRVEPSLAGAEPGSLYQFERMGYFCADVLESRKDHLVFNRTVTLRDEWARIQKEEKKEPGPKALASKPGPAPSPAEKRAGAPSIPEVITMDDFSKIDLRVGIIREAGLVQGADKLIKLMVDLGEGRVRQIFAGIRSAYPDPRRLVGRRVMVVANLKPRQMKFGLSEGMILAGVGKKSLGIATFDADLNPGDKVS
jgi:methionine--tRNA ligase beta chain